MAKTDEIKAGREQINAKTQELATTDEKLAESKESLVSGRGVLDDAQGEVLNHWRRAGRARTNVTPSRRSVVDHL